MANVGPLTAEIDSGVWGRNPANFNGFSVLPSLLQRCLSTEVNQILHDVSPSPGLVHYKYIFGGSGPLTEFCSVQFQVLRSPILAALMHDTSAAGSAKLCGVVQGMELQKSRRGCHLYSAGRPSRWASAHIVVNFVYFYVTYRTPQNSGHILRRALTSKNTRKLLTFSETALYALKFHCAVTYTVQQLPPMLYF